MTQQDIATNEEQAQTIERIIYPLFKAQYWLKILGIAAWVIGILLTLTIVGLIFSWLFIWMGVLLFQMTGNIQKAYTYGDSQALRLVFRKLKILAILWGIFSILSLIGILPNIFFFEHMSSIIH